MNSSKDEELIALFLSRDERALAQTSRRYGGYLHTVVRNVLKSERDCEECENDVLLKLWNSIPPELPRSFKAYLTSVARGVALDRFRANVRKKREISEYAVSMEELYDLFECGDDTAQSVENDLLRDALNRFIGSLDKKRRYIFVSRFCLSCPIKEIAKELGVNESTVFYDLRVMKAQLKEHLEKEGF